MTTTTLSFLLKAFQSVLTLLIEQHISYCVLFNPLKMYFFSTHKIIMIPYIQNYHNIEIKFIIRQLQYFSYKNLTKLNAGI